MKRGKGEWKRLFYVQGAKFRVEKNGWGMINKTHGFMF